MALSNLGYSLREAMHHFVRNWTTALGAIITIFLSLFIIGLFVVGSGIVNSAIGNVEQQVTINAFISDDASDDAIKSFQNKLESWENVSDVSFKTKEDARKDYTGMSNSAEATMSALDGENPLPRSFVIKMDDPSQVEGTASKIKSDPDFKKIVDKDDVASSVLYGQKEVDRLFTVTGYMRLAAIVLVALLTFIALVFINNTIRLSITARRREIAIMRLVGASNGFIRGPFITEGIIQAVIGALLAIGVLEMIRNMFIPRIQGAISWMQLMLPLHLYLLTYAALIFFGLLIGFFGSVIAMRRYLKV
ncbi:cell division protein FtsX [Coriobacterium glomerans PW2]|uniref:Cell division protein FtsX n=1 Tax=Coriobacterium glomerans (strain ATCC 49209 / DSM 20642 / JCM 10262 / PW2) TaxID=700015 RepID=F2NBM3_CORGP|nr:permease-like cell division protein FtsX [Coriobacterium glomerans]AEB06759.1 cell division protein FtsX [Coriobacterium glomerans PW2]